MPSGNVISVAITTMINEPRMAWPAPPMLSTSSGVVVRMSLYTKLGRNPLAPFIKTLTKIDIQGMNAAIAADAISRLATLLRRSLAISFLPRTRVIPSTNRKLANSQPSTPAKPVMSTNTTAARATAAANTRSLRCADFGRFQGCVGVGTAAKG